MVKKITKANIIMQFTENYDKRYYLRELAALLGKPHQTIKPYLEKLASEKILLKNQRKNILEYNINFKNKQTYDYLVIAEKEKLIEKLIDNPILKILFEKLAHFFEKNTFIIFGSASKKIKKGSDLDLLIIGKSDLDKTLEEFEEVYNKKIHKIQIDNLKKLNMTIIKEIYKKHIILNNTEKVVKFLGGLHEKNKLV